MPTTPASWTTGSPPLVRERPMFNDNFELGNIPNYVPLWVANTASVNYLKVENPELNIPVWQYSDAGNIAGINVDLDVWY